MGNGEAAGGIRSGIRCIRLTALNLHLLNDPHERLTCFVREYAVDQLGVDHVVDHLTVGGGGHLRRNTSCRELTPVDGPAIVYVVTRTPDSLGARLGGVVGHHLSYVRAGQSATPSML